MMSRSAQRSATFSKDMTTIAKDILSNSLTKNNEAIAGVMGVLDGWVKSRVVPESVIMEFGRKLAAADRDPPPIIAVPDARNVFNVPLPVGIPSAHHDHPTPVRSKLDLSPPTAYYPFGGSLAASFGGSPATSFPPVSAASAGGCALPFAFLAAPAEHHGLPPLPPITEAEGR
jgi:hypothetical protein